MWKIDRDYLDGGDIDTCSRSWDDKLASTATVRFRMLDGDGQVYYGGRCTPEVEFQPLHDFGTPNAGCTTIQFRVDGRWQTL